MSNEFYISIIIYLILGYIVSRFFSHLDIIDDFFGRILTIFLWLPCLILFALIMFFEFLFGWMFK